MLRRVRTVRVTTKDELDAALTTADQIAVEGDDQLLTYAVNKAVKDDPENRVVIEASRLRSYQNGYGANPEEIARDSEARREFEKATLEAKEARSELNRAALPSPRCSTALPRLALRTVILTAVFIIGGSAVLLFLRPSSASLQSGAPPDNVAHDVTHGPGPNNDLVGNDGYLAHRLGIEPGVWGSLPSLLWPLVAIVAIVAMFLIARQAISSGSNVTVVWKVTEKVSGRVVITKVKDRTSRATTAAQPGRV